MGEKLMAIEVHLEKRIVNHNVIREADPKSHRDYIVVTIMAAMFLFGLFVYGWQHYQWIQYGYRIEEAQKRKEQLAEVGRQLRLERASLRSPQRIDSLARRSLGMVPPGPGQLVNVGAEGTWTAPEPLPSQPVQTRSRIRPQPAAIEVKR
jgi:cell division protein FtsL